MNRRVLTLLAAAAACAGAQGVLAQTAPILSAPVRIAVDSGRVASPAAGNGAVVVWSHMVTVNHVPWLRLKFDQVAFAGQLAAGNGGYMLITSMRDGGQQRLDAKSIGDWSNTSAYFNGDSVLMELYAFPGTGQSRIAMSEVTAGIEGIGPQESICGPTDDRTLSNYMANARLMPIGCTAWLIDLGNCANRFLTAGHCIAVGTTNAVIQFNVPLSTSGGTPVNPAPQDQYPAITASIQSNGGLGIGLDAAQFFTPVNSTTNLAPRFAQNASYTVASAAPQPSNQVTRITGYGVTSSPISPTWSQVQKTHTGAFVSRNPPSSLQYTADTTGGNSGSPVVLESTGLAIGIHTHGGCTSTGGANSGTAIDYATLQGYLANPIAGHCIPFIPPTLTLNHTPGTLVPAGSPIDVDLEIVPGTQQVVPGSPTVHYRYAAGSFTSLPLVNTGGNNWEASLPAPDCGNEPEYYFTAQGNAGANLSLPENAPTELFALGVGTINQQVNAITGFESGLPAGWSATGLWNVSTNTCGAGAACEGTSVARYSNANCTYNTGAANSGNLTSGLVLLPSVAPGESLTLEYCSALVTENNPSYDHAYVFINNTQVDQAGDTATWATRVVDISAFGGQSVTIRFNFDTVDGVLNDFAGWRVDNIRIRKSAVVCESCYPDCNQSGNLTIADFGCFQAAFSAGNMYADCNNSGTLTIADFGCFQGEFAAGCP